MGSQEEDHQSKVPFSSHHIQGRCCQPGLSLMVLPLIKPAWGSTSQISPLWSYFLSSYALLFGKDSDAERDWGQEEKGTTEDEMAGWHHWLNGRESEWTPGVGDGQGGLALQFMGLQRVGHDWATELNWTELMLYSFGKKSLSAAHTQGVFKLHLLEGRVAR